jgi:sugar lactone lactonase YvrE
VTTPQILLTGLVFGESPRWHDGRLWFSDMGANEVRTVDLDGRSEVVADVPGMPMGLGWLPDGRLLIVSSQDGRLLSRDSDGTLTTYADLSGLGSGHPWSDMVVDGRGNAYVGNIGFDFPAGDVKPGILALVTRDGAVRQVADDVLFPNGMAVTPDNATLILAESYAHRLTAFDIAPDGGLVNRRAWAELGEGVPPDGICIDAEGAVWTGVGSFDANDVGRVLDGGEVLDRVALDMPCFACMLGGEDRRTLFMLTADWRMGQGFEDNVARLTTGPRTGRLLTAPVRVPGAGWP